MIIRYRREIHQGAVVRLDQVSLPTAGNGESGHTHSNLSFLDQLNIDSSRRLLFSSQILDLPLLSEDW